MKRKPNEPIRPHGLCTVMMMGGTRAVPLLRKRFRCMRTMMLAAWCLCWLATSPVSAQTNTLFPVRGIDVSHWQGKVKWRKVRKSGYRFAYIKATQGTGYQDPKFKRNWRKSRRKAFHRGAYHFFVSNLNGKEQARHFMDRVKRYRQGDLPPVVDVERLEEGTTTEDLVRELNAFMQEVESRWKVKPIIYSNSYFFQTHIQGHVDTTTRDGLRVVELWVARYRSRPPELKAWTFWQHSDKGQVPGIKGNTDLNYFFGKPEDWEDYVNRLR
ncbi:MAG: GH25 family lysozyme [Bacteroidota bacterium]